MRNDKRMRLGRKGPSARKGSRYRPLVLVVAVSLALAACSGGSNVADDAENAGKDAEASRLTFAVPATPTTLDPEFSSNPQDRESDVSVYDRFTQFATTSEDGVLQADLHADVEPLLAESWEVSDDGRKYTFKLREGVLSYFGNELTTDDVIWSWDRVFDMESQGMFPLGVSSIEAGGYEAIDDYTLEVTLSDPNPLLPSVLATPVPGAVIYDATEAQSHSTEDDLWATDWLASSTASFGPYHATEFSPGQQVVYEANPNYFQGEPDIKQIIYREIPEAANRISLLRAGEVDVVEGLDAEQRQSLQGQDGVNVVSVPGNLMIAFGLNNEIAPFDDPLVRKAVAHALPIGDIIETVFYGDETVRLFEGYVADTFPGYPDYWPYQPRDVDAAKALLEEAGATGASFELSYSSIFPEHERIAQLIRTALNEIGLEAELSRLTPARFQEHYYGRNAQAVLVQDASFVSDPVYPLYLFFGEGAGAVGNWIQYGNESTQDLIAEALAEPDPEERLRLGEEANAAIVDDVPWAMHLGIGFHLAMRDDVSGFVWRPHNLVHFNDLSKS